MVWTSSAVRIKKINIPGKIGIKSEFIDMAGSISSLPVEHSVVFDAEGNVLEHNTSGEKDRVILWHSDLFRLSGKIFMHNHPSGTSFSLNDIHTACMLEMAGMIAVTGKYIYCLFPREERDTFQRGDYSDIVRCYTIRCRMLPLSGRFKSPEKAWEHVAIDMGLRYLKITLPSCMQSEEDLK